jgi:hypothetical protein
MAVTRVSFVGGRDHQPGTLGGFPDPPATDSARQAELRPRGAEWTIERARAIRGAALPEARSLRRAEGADFVDAPGAPFSLRAVRSNDRYVARAEKDRLLGIQQGLGRPDSRAAALIPIRKTDAWWALTQDERRALFEERSRHIAIGLEYLPAVARQLYHCRDLGEPFDFLTWFEFDPADAAAFDELVGRLRETDEWRYVDREVELRLRR